MDGLRLFFHLFLNYNDVMAAKVAIMFFFFQVLRREKCDR
jgi:hypothetical protein